MSESKRIRYLFPGSDFWVSLKFFLCRISLKKLLRLSRYIFITTFLRKVPFTLILGITDSCNCHCEHCSVKKEVPQKEKQPLQLKDFQKVISDFAKMGGVKVNFFGGEPLLCPYLEELIQFGANLGLVTCMDTNGTLINEEKVISMKRSGLDFLFISLDSSLPQEHDRIRGYNGAYEKVLELSKHCLKHRIPFVLSAIASRKAIQTEELTQILKLAQKQGALALRYLFPMISGKWGGQSSMALSKEERKEVYRFLKYGYTYVESGFSFKADSGEFFCAARKQQIIYIDPYGDLSFCYTSNISYGNIKEMSLKTLIQNMWASQLFKETHIEGCIRGEKV